MTLDPRCAGGCGARVDQGGWCAHCWPDAFVNMAPEKELLLEAESLTVTSGPEYKASLERIAFLVHVLQQEGRAEGG